MIFIDYQLLQESDLVCKVTIFFRIIQVYLAYNFERLLISLLFNVYLAKVMVR